MSSNTGGTSGSRTPSMVDSFERYNTQIEAEEADISNRLSELSAEGRKPSLAEMMNFTLEINSVMTQATLMITQNANYFKMLNNIAQRAVVA